MVDLEEYTSPLEELRMFYDGLREKSMLPPPPIKIINQSIIDGGMITKTHVFTHNGIPISETIKFEVLDFSISNSISDLKTKYYVDLRIMDRHSSYYIPPYFAVFGSDRPMVTPPLLLPESKVMKNIRPKGTKTNRKRYR